MKHKGTGNPNNLFILKIPVGIQLNIVPYVYLYITPTHLLA